MADTRIAAARISTELEAAARQGSPELAAVNLSTLLRAGLAMLAGAQPAEAANMATGRIGRPPRDRGPA